MTTGRIAIPTHPLNPLAGKPEPANDARQTADTPSPGSQTSPSQYTDKARRRGLLQDIMQHSYGTLPLAQATHNGNVERVCAAVETFIEQFVATNPNASPVDIRKAICQDEENLARIIDDANIDLSCYQAAGSGEKEFGKFLAFSSLSMPLFKNVPFCFQLFHFDSKLVIPGLDEFRQETVPHDHPYKTTVVECASIILRGTINERTHIKVSSAKTIKTGKHHRGVGSYSKVKNPFPHSLKNIGNGPANSLHPYMGMDGVSEGQTRAVEDVFIDLKDPQNEVYEAYHAFVARILAGEQDDREALQEISAGGLPDALRENRFGAAPVLVDIREPREVIKTKTLHVEGVDVLYAPRGVAVAEILRKYPDPDNSPHLLLSCRSDGRSALLADELKTLGYKVTSLSDGAAGCAAQGLAKEYDEEHDEDYQVTEKWRNGFDLTPTPRLFKHIEGLKSTLSPITAGDLAKKKLEKDEVVVFDVRQEDELSHGVIPHAQRVAAGLLEKNARFHAHDSDTLIVVYSGGDDDYRALLAAKNLGEMGYSNVRYLEGGYASYKNALKSE